MIAVLLAHGHSHGFLTYLWHYVLARLVYDDVVRPLTNGRLGPLLIAAGVVAIVLVLAHGRGRRRSAGRGRGSAGRGQP